MRQSNTGSLFKRLLHRIGVLCGAAAMTLLFFLVLPLIQIISKPPATDLVLQTANVALPPPPPPLEQPEPEKEPEPEQKPPELVENTPPLDLSQLELALNPGGEGAGHLGDFARQLAPLTAARGENVDALFSLADLDQKPRVVYQPGPTLNHQIRKKAPGTVYIIFVVDQRGRVENPVVQKSNDPVFNAPALAAVKQWKFEPGKRNGQPVRFRMRVPISFPKG